jgi:hypothetical protein
VVPGLMFAGRMQIVDAIGTSLFAVGSFGLTTAINYSLSGQVDWLVAAEFVGGGVVGALLGTQARQSPRTQAWCVESRFLSDNHFGRGLHALSLMADAMTFDRFRRGTFIFSDCERRTRALTLDQRNISIDAGKS